MCVRAHMRVNCRPEVVEMRTLNTERIRPSSPRHHGIRSRAEMCLCKTDIKTLLQEISQTLGLNGFSNTFTFIMSKSAHNSFHRPTLITQIHSLLRCIFEKKKKKLNIKFGQRRQQTTSIKILIYSIHLITNLCSITHTQHYD